MYLVAWLNFGVNGTKIIAATTCVGPKNARGLVKSITSLQVFVESATDVYFSCSEMIHHRLVSLSTSTSSGREMKRKKDSGFQLKFLALKLNREKIFLLLHFERKRPKMDEHCLNEMCLFSSTSHLPLASAE